MNLRRMTGFTLIEAMIVVVIIGILAAIAYPSFTEQVRKSRRSDAKASLQALQLNQEKWRANHIAYTTSLASLGMSTDSHEEFYNLSILSMTPTVAATAFIATAVPKSGTDQATDKCGTFAIDQNGPNGTGTYADVDGCWR